jgi:glycosyltransferase involved in cell wall biosynthesis
MRIVLQSRAYWPHLGGIETVARLLVEEFVGLGHSVVVITQTPGTTADAGPVTVLRCAPWRRQLAELEAADVVLMFGTSLRFLPLAVLQRCPTVVSHHGWYDGWRPAAVLKRCINRFTRNVAPSAAVARALAASATVIPNPYDDELFHLRPEIERSGELVFVGRLVSDKGVLLLIEALGLLARDGVRPSLTVIGSGPEAERCRQQAVALGVERQIAWAGSLQGEALAAALARHRVLVIPSLWHEPFGVVALEGLASGCALVGSAGGGLPEAMGSGARSFPNGDVAALAAALRAALGEMPVPRSADVEAHLRQHARRAVAQRFLEVLETAAR